MDKTSPAAALPSKWRLVGIVIAGLLVVAVATGGTMLVLKNDSDTVANHNALLDEITRLKDSARELQVDNQKLQTATAQPIDDVSVVTKTIRADCEAEVGLQTKMADNVKIDLPFATANVECANPQVTTSIKSYEAILKKVNGSWTLISRRSGTAVIDRLTRDKYGIPLTLK